MNVDAVIEIEQEIRSTELRRRIMTGLKTAFALGAYDPNAALVDKENFLNAILDDIFRDLSINQDCGAV